MNQGYFITTLVDGTSKSYAIADLSTGLQPTIWAKPVAGDTITVDYSIDGGHTWETPWVNATTAWTDVLVGSVTHIRFTRSAGAGTTSTAGVI